MLFRSLIDFLDAQAKDKNRYVEPLEWGMKDISPEARKKVADQVAGLFTANDASKYSSPVSPTEVAPRETYSNTTGNRTSQYNTKEDAPIPGLGYGLQALRNSQIQLDNIKANVNAAFASGLPSGSDIAGLAAYKLDKQQGRPTTIPRDYPASNMKLRLMQAEKEARQAKGEKWSHPDPYDFRTSTVN